MHEKRFEGDADRLRFPERVERLEVIRVVDLCLDEVKLNSVLDVGTGTGLFAQEFSRRGMSVSGVDVNPEMLLAAGFFIPEGVFRVGEAESLPYPEGSFDLVFLGLVLHETDKPFQALKEAGRVARKQVCILEWPYHEQPFGPPLSDRLNPQELFKLFEKACFRSWKVNDLTNTILYKLEL